MNQRGYLRAGLVAQFVGAIGAWLAWPGQESGPVEPLGQMASNLVFLVAVAVLWVGTICSLVWAVAAGVRFGLHGTVATIKVPRRNRTNKAVSLRKAG